MATVDDIQAARAWVRQIQETWSLGGASDTLLRALDALEYEYILKADLKSARDAAEFNMDAVFGIDRARRAAEEEVARLRGEVASLAAERDGMQNLATAASREVARLRETVAMYQGASAQVMERVETALNDHALERLIAERDRLAADLHHMSEAWKTADGDAGMLVLQRDKARGERDALRDLNLATRIERDRLAATLARVRTEVARWAEAATRYPAPEVKTMGMTLLRALDGDAKEGT